MLYSGSMLSHLKPKVLLLLLAAGVLVPFVLALILGKLTSSDHGVFLTSSGSASVHESSFGAAFSRLNSQSAYVEVVSHVWSPDPNVCYLTARRAANFSISVGQKDVFTTKGKRRVSNPIHLPEGFSEVRIRIETAPGFQQPIQFTCGDDSVSSAEIPSSRLYLQPSKRSVLLQQLSQTLRLIASFFLVLIIVLILLRLFLPFLLTKLPEGRPRWIFFAALALMLFIRLMGIGYQMEETLHPDEKFYGRMIEQIRAGEIAPMQFWYNTGFFFITAAAHETAEFLTDKPLNQNATQRAVSMLSSWLTCIVIFIVGERLFSYREGLIAMVLFGFSFMPVDLSHLGIVEPSMVFFFLLAFAGIVFLDQNPSNARFALIGALSGIAVAMKQTAAFIVIPFLIAWILLLTQRRISRTGLREIAICGIAAFATFFALSPGTILEFSRFYHYQVLQTQSLEGESATHLFFVGRKGILGSWLVTGLHSAVGYPLMIAALIGILLIWKRSSKAALLCVPLMVVYAAVTANIKTVPEHYALLMCPFIALFAAVAVTSIPLQARLQKWAAVLIVVILLASPVYNIAILTKLLVGTDTRRQAAEWCYKSLPTGSRIDYEMFGPRFLIPAFDASRLRLFKRPAFENYFGKRRTQYYVEDSITSEIFSSVPEHFPVEMEWFRNVRQKGTLVKEFRGRRFRLLNPDIRIYKLGTE